MARVLSDFHDLSALAMSVAPQSILVVASRQAVYQSLAEAFQQHFRTHDVVLAEKGAKWGVMAASLCLVLISMRAGDEGDFPGLIELVRAKAPGVPIGLLVDDGHEALDLSVIGEVEGVLPLSLPLDVLLAVTALLLAGGHYRPNGRPRRMEVAQVSRSGEEIDCSTPPLAMGSGSASPDVDVSMLTMREEQILQYVSEGFQNKLIANRMALSEHTVKAHVHKVIAKLGVSNRTQAAAAFLRRKHGGSRQISSEARQP